MTALVLSGPAVRCPARQGNGATQPAGSMLNTTLRRACIRESQMLLLRSTPTAWRCGIVDGIKRLCSEWNVCSETVFAPSYTRIQRPLAEDRPDDWLGMVRLSTGRNGSPQ